MFYCIWGDIIPRYIIRRPLSVHTVSKIKKHDFESDSIYINIKVSAKACVFLVWA